MTRSIQWIALVILTAVAVWCLQRGHAPAAALLGPLVVGILFALAGAPLKPPPVVRLASQTTIGCVIAGVLGAEIAPAILHQMAPALAVSGATLLLSLGLGWLLLHWRWFDVSTSMWGLAPGASAVMMTMAEADGGDPRVVALLQYFRILLVAFAAIGIAHVLGAPPDHPVAAREPQDLDPMALLATVVFGLGAAWLGQISKAPAGPLLMSTLAGAALVALGWIELQVPTVVALGAYAVVGWSIGAGFLQSDLVRMVRLLPRMILAVLALLLVCAGFGVIASQVFGLNPLTAYLAASPGGVDTMLIISTATAVDLPFVLACQVIRFLLVVAISPWLIKTIISLHSERTVARPEGVDSQG